MYSFSTKVSVADETLKFFYEVGHYDNTGMWHCHVVSPGIYESFGAADVAAERQVRHIKAALNNRKRKEMLAMFHVIYNDPKPMTVQEVLRQIIDKGGVA